MQRCFFSLLGLPLRATPPGALLCSSVDSRKMFQYMFFFLRWLILHLAAGELDYISQGKGMQLQGDYSLAGLFPLHYTKNPNSGFPALVPCDQ